jgi:hypothetical protein
MAKKGITIEQKSIADAQLRNLQHKIEYDTKDFTVEHIVNKFNEKEFFIPSYQRKYVWKDKQKTYFIESVLLGLPIPFMFFGDCEDEGGRYEIIDGAQRIQTLSVFLNNNLSLSKNNLKELSELNDFRFSDLSEIQQRRFRNRALRVVVLGVSTTGENRQDIFNRINTSGMKAEPTEIRRGSYPGKLSDFIDRCSKDVLFVKLCPVSENKQNRYEHFELVLRFFAYVNDYLKFDHRVSDFLDWFLIENQNTFDEKYYIKEFNKTLNFINNYFPNGFSKVQGANSTPRVRFEAISVGVALALRLNPDLKIANIDWVDSDEFKKLTTSDASNNQGRLKDRVEYVRDQLLNGAING